MNTGWPSSSTEVSTTGSFGSAVPISSQPITCEPIASSASHRLASRPGVKVKCGSNTANASAPTIIPSVESSNGPERGPGVRLASR